MKIRQGFVSNSSSSSFCIYGKSFNIAPLLELANKLKVKYKKSEFKKDSDDNFVNENCFDQLNDIAYSIAKKTGLSHHMFYDYDGSIIYLGRSYDTLQDDETGGDFKKSVEKILGEECCYIEEIIES
jgi:hypothetical protein